MKKRNMSLFLAQWTVWLQAIISDFHISLDYKTRGPKFVYMSEFVGTSMKYIYIEKYSLDYIRDFI
jgi:hypothetical protein